MDMGIITGTFQAVVEVIPESAWIQAVFVCLFIVLVVYLIEKNSKLQRDWQEFMSGENLKWQKFLADQTTSVTVSLERIKDCLNTLSDNLLIHDAKVDARINDATHKVSRDTERIINKKPKPDKTKEKEI